MSRMHSQQIVAALVFSAVLTACQGAGNRGKTETADSNLGKVLANCSADIQAFRSQADEDGTANASAPALSLFPFLHSNRFLHRLSHSVQSDTELRQWTMQLAMLAVETRASENKNLATPWSNSSLEELADCSRNFASEAQHQQGRRAVLAAVQQSEFLPHYLNSRQIFGAISLLRPFLKQRILALHVDERKWFLEDESFLSSNTYTSEAPASELLTSEINDWMREAYSSNQLGLPLLQEPHLDSLFALHSPTLKIEFSGDNDRIGSPTWQSDQVKINTEDPAIYTLPSMTQFEGRNLLQLNYVFWFPSRRPEALIDLYSGNVDSIIWRVTLNENGQVLLYDSIHSCGCYHKYFLVSDSLTAKGQAASKEPANIFRLNSTGLQDKRTLAITANEHYIVGVSSNSSSTQEESIDYDLDSYELLQNLESPRGTRSLFDDKGLLTGSERLERFTLWPTGIVSVGAMRQWGTHATGFIEEQHFDDANLLDKYFETSQ